MAMKVKWASVVVGNVTTTYRADEALAGSVLAEEITVDEHTMGLTVHMKDGTIRAHVGCPYVLCMEDVPEIIVPDIEIVS